MQKSNQVNFSDIDPSRVATWKQRIGINTRLTSLIADELNLPFSDVRKVVGSEVTNDKTLSHGVCQKYFKITDIKQVDPDLVSRVSEVLSSSKKVAPKKAVKKVVKKTVKKAVKDTSTASSEALLAEMLSQMTVLIDKQAQIDDRLNILEVS